jgi:hypothetical protein
MGFIVAGDRVKGVAVGDRLAGGYSWALGGPRGAKAKQQRICGEAGEPQ